MNSEKQFTEYKIIDTTITPVYEGAPIETHPEDLLGGAEPPEQTKWKKTINSLGNAVFCETRGNDVLIITKNSQGYMPIVRDGIIYGFNNYPDAAINAFFVDPLNAKGYNLPSSGWIEEITTLNEGDDMPNWGEYQELL